MLEIKPDDLVINTNDALDDIKFKELMEIMGENFYLIISNYKQDTDKIMPSRMKPQLRTKSKTLDSLHFIKERYNDC